MFKRTNSFLANLKPMLYRFSNQSKDVSKLLLFHNPAKNTIGNFRLASDLADFLDQQN
jgi:hypothetical protein